jgi:Tol biopolymer transport system component
MTRLKARLCFSATLGSMPLGLLMLVTVLTLNGCGELFFRRNPDLKLFRQDSSGAAFDPVWTPGGGSLRFLLAERFAGEGGQLRAIRPDGSDERLVRDGVYGSLSISPAGARLALVAVTTGSRNIGGVLLLLDTLGTVLDTLSSPEDNVTFVRYSRSNETLYCYINNKGVFRLDMGSRGMDMIVSANLYDWQDFDTWGDTLLALPGMVYHLLSGRTDSMLVLRQPRFCPYDPTVLLGVQGTNQFLDDLVLVDRGTGSVTHLGANPYYSCDIMDPCWSPDGKSILMSAAELVSAGFGGGQVAGTYNLWVLRR